MQYNQYQKSLAVRREWLQNKQDNFYKIRFYSNAFKYVFVPLIVLMVLFINLIK